MQLMLDQILSWTKGRALSQFAREFSQIGTDTRKDLTGQLFIALKGEDFNGHSFLKAAVEKGALGLLVHEWDPQHDELKKKVTVIQVEDTLMALQRLGHGKRKSSSARFIGITGSNGKTTTKEFTAQILSNYKKTHFSEGSFNNHWGVPMTLLAEPDANEVAIVEMGMNHKNEISALMKLAEPDIVVCTTVGTAHIEHFGSIEKIAEAKEEIYESARPEAVFVFNRDNELTKKMEERYLDHQRIGFSNLDSTQDVFLKVVTQTAKSLLVEGVIKGVSGRVEVSVFGKHNTVNLAAAAALSLAAGLTPEQVWQGLKSCKTPWGRNQWVELKSGAEILFDGYNANPDSMGALLSNCKEMVLTGKKMAVLAQMLELGKDSAAFHIQIGEKAADVGFDAIWFYGPDWKSFQQGFESRCLALRKSTDNLMISEAYKDSLASQIASVLQPKDIIFVKGSRGMKLEKFVNVCDPLSFSLNKKIEKK